jgi:excisionase family DNA binding protein
MSQPDRQTVIDALNCGRLFLSVPELSVLFGVDPQGRTVRRAIKQGEIPATRVGPQWHIPAEWVREQARLGGEIPA